MGELTNYFFILGLLSKLEAEYGEMKIYMKKDLKNSLFFTNYKEVDEAVRNYCSDINCYESDEFDAAGVFAVIRGKNDTGIVLRWLQYDNVELIYSKLDTYQYLNEMQAILEGTTDNREDAGI